MLFRSETVEVPSIPEVTRQMFIGFSCSSMFHDVLRPGINLSNREPIVGKKLTREEAHTGHNMLYGAHFIRI